jgi:hypothetical protein
VEAWCFVKKTNSKFRPVQNDFRKLLCARLNNFAAFSNGSFPGMQSSAK